MSEPAVDLSEVLDALPSLVVVVDSTEQVRYANAAVSDWLGTTAAAAPGLSARQLMGEQSYEVASDRIRAALRGERQTFERAIDVPDGPVAHTLTEYLPRWRAGHLDGFIVLVTDITRRVIAEHAHAAGQERIAELRDRSRAAAGHTDQVLQELFAIGLHLERVRRLEGYGSVEADRVLTALASTIETLRSATKALANDLPERSDDA